MSTPSSPTVTESCVVLGCTRAQWSGWSTCQEHTPTATNDEPRTEAEKVAKAGAGLELVTFGHRQGWDAALTEVEEAVGGLTYGGPARTDYWRGHRDATDAVVAAVAGLRR